MIYVSYYKSIIGDILIASKENKLVGLWIENQKYYLGNFKEEIVKDNSKEILIKTKEWLDRYFNGEKPSIKELDIELIGSEFRKNVWNKLLDIPYGKTITYKEIANKIAIEMGVKTMSSQAVGSAIGHNPISIIVPCHRVIGSNGSLKGYAAGVNVKAILLKHENININGEFYE